jgi:hypothetical protein
MDARRRKKQTTNEEEGKEIGGRGGKMRRGNMRRKIWGK